MADETVQYFLQIIQNNDLELTDDFTEEARVLFEQGNDALRMYRGHPDELMQGLQFYAATRNSAYFYAGAAKVVYDAAYISDGKHGKSGTNEAKKLYDKALVTGGGRYEIDMIKTMFIDESDLKARRQVLDEMSERPESKQDYGIAVQEMSYYGQREEFNLMEHWFNIALERASNDIQRLSALNRVASIHLMSKNRERCLPYYQRVVTLDPNDPWAWHNMSIVYAELGNDEQAGYCNRRALDIGQFGAATSVLDSLVRNWSRQKHDDLLVEIPRYRLSDDARADFEKQQESGFFRRLFSS